MSVSFKKHVLKVVWLLAVALGVCYAGSQADKYFEQGYSYSQNKEYGKALQYYQKAANMGNANAYSNLGVMYANGDGVGQDKEAARQYYKKACDLGDQQGCQNLKALAPKHAAYELNFDIQKKEFDLFGEGLGTLIEITSKNRDPIRLEGIVINEGNSCNDWSQVMADGRPARGNKKGYILKYSQGYMIGVACLPYKILSL
ncbi:tetratricopeptide repeat protein [Helicobacter felis]|uniref:tetratricopeptide repeat protein n=1 Tax=Helicobacter felis TaxID=214 RepID=UPI000EF645A8|nr:tetratricopeptide repeat protein [Helicobacter felis]